MMMMIGIKIQLRCRLEKPFDWTHATDNDYTRRGQSVDDEQIYEDDDKTEYTRWNRAGDGLSRHSHNNPNNKTKRETLHEKSSTMSDNLSEASSVASDMTEKEFQKVLQKSIDETVHTDEKIVGYKEKRHQQVKDRQSIKKSQLNTRRNGNIVDNDNSLRSRIYNRLSVIITSLRNSNNNNGTMIKCLREPTPLTIKARLSSTA
jgi:hypothetical protein